jgi:hypothetical protein
MGSISDDIITFFNQPNPSRHAMGLASTQPLTEMRDSETLRATSWSVSQELFEGREYLLIIVYKT